MTKFFRRKLGGQKGFTLIELMVVVAIIGILAAIAIPLYANVQARARTAKAQADLRAMASAISMFQAHTGNLPPDLPTLLVAAPNNQVPPVMAGPFLGAVPQPPATWTAYVYAPNAVAGTFTITTSGDGQNLQVP